jgi:hypothetical protein
LYKQASGTNRSVDTSRKYKSLIRIGILVSRFMTLLASILTPPTERPNEAATNEPALLRQGSSQGPKSVLQDLGG